MEHVSLLPQLTNSNSVFLFYTFFIALNYDLHLNACCETERVEGDFLYTPCEGSILDAGEHTIHCIFKPHDTVNQMEVEMEIVVFVRRSVPAVKWDR